MRIHWSKFNLIIVLMLFILPSLVNLVAHEKRGVNALLNSFSSSVTDDAESTNLSNSNTSVSYLNLDHIGLVSRFFELQLTNNSEVSLSVFGPQINYTASSLRVTDLRKNSSAVNVNENQPYLKTFEHLLQKSNVNFSFNYYIISDSIFSYINASNILSLISDQLDNSSGIVLLFHYNIYDDVSLEKIDQEIYSKVILKNKILITPLIQLGRGPTEFSSIHDSTMTVVINSVYKIHSGEREIFSSNSWKTFDDSFGHLSGQKVWKPDIVFPGNIFLPADEESTSSYNQSIYPLRRYEFSIYASLLFSTYLIQILASINTSLYNPIRLISAIKHSAWIVNTESTAQGMGMPDFVNLYNSLQQNEIGLTTISTPSWSNRYFPQQNGISTLFAEVNNTLPIQLSISRSIDDSTLAIEDLGEFNLYIRKSDVELLVSIPENARIVTLNLNLNPLRNMINSTVRVSISFESHGEIIGSKEIVYFVKPYIGQFCFLEGFELSSTIDKITLGLMDDTLLLRSFLFSLDIHTVSCDFTDIQYPAFDGIIVVNPKEELKEEKRALLDEFVQQGGQIWFFVGNPEKRLRTIVFQSWIDEEIRIHEFSSTISVSKDILVRYFGKLYEVPPEIYFHSNESEFQTTIKMRLKRYIILPENYNVIYSKDPAHRFEGVLYQQELGSGQRWIFSSLTLISYFYRSFVSEDDPINVLNPIITKNKLPFDPVIMDGSEEELKISIDERYSSQLIDSDSYIAVTSNGQTSIYPISTTPHTIPGVSLNNKLTIVVHLKGNLRFIKETIFQGTMVEFAPPPSVEYIGLGILFVALILYSILKTKKINLRYRKDCPNCGGIKSGDQCRWCSHERL